MNVKKIQLFMLEHLVWVVAIAAYTVFVFLTPSIFFNLSNIDIIFHSTAAVGVIAIGEGIVLLSGSMDLSLAAIGGLGGVFVVMFPIWFPSLPAVFLLLLPLLIGAAFGAVNGLFISRTGIHPFLITLATLIIFEGLKRAIQLRDKMVQTDLVLIPGGGYILPGLSYSMVLLLLTAFLMWLLLNHTPLGVRIYGIGGNAISAALTGVNVKNMRLFVHTIAGAIGGLGGLLFVGYNQAYTATMMEGQIFMVFAMAVFGGIALYGGRGNIEDVVAGVFFIGTVENGLIFLDVNPHLRYLVVGVFIILGVFINSVRFEMRDRLLMSI